MPCGITGHLLPQPPALLHPRGSVAQIVRDSPHDSKVLVGLHEQTYTPTNRTKNWRTYNAALKQRGSLQVWFDPESIWLAEPSRKRGRSATFTDAAIQTCLTLKGEGRPGNDPVDRFSPERAAPGDDSGCRCGRRPGWWQAS